MDKIWQTNLVCQRDIATSKDINNLYQAGLTFVKDNINQLEKIAVKILEND
jgi:hypothetical protein